MQNAYTTLVELREQALTALKAYNMLRYGTEEKPETLTGEERNVSTEDGIKILSSINGFKLKREGYDYMELWGPLAEIKEPFEQGYSIENYKIVLEHAKANRLKYIAWFAYMQVINNQVSTYSVMTEYYKIQIEPNGRIHGDETNVEHLLNHMIKAYPTQDNMRVAMRKYENHVSRYEVGIQQARERNGEIKDTGLEKIFNEGPKFGLWADKVVIVDQFDKIAEQLPSNGLASRTWGFEVEVPDAKNVETYPGSGIEKGEDGSLRSYESSDECDCDCDDCTYHDCDCELCDNRNDDPEHCGNSHCTTADSAEFRTIGGIQRVKHNGLYDLCNKLQEAEAEINDTAGTHIHVFAADLTMNQVGQVFAMYKRLENMLGIIAGRDGNHYSSRIPVDTVRYAIRKSDPRIIADKPRAINASHLFNDRGTLEFRQMDCNLNANKITSWAWLVRGMVTVAQRGAKLKDVMSVNDINDLIKVYAKFNYFMNDETPGLVIPGTKADSYLVKRSNFAHA